MSIFIKQPSELDAIRRAGRVVANVLSAVKLVVRPGVSTKDVDLYIEELIVKQGAVASCKNYTGYPAASCISVNEQAVHCVPSPTKILRAGDVVKVDVVAGVDGFHADSAVTIVIPPAPQEVVTFVARCYEALMASTVHVAQGKSVRDISKTLQAHAVAGGYGIVKDFVGHGIGRDIHEDPRVHGFVTGKPSPTIYDGMALCIEPIWTIKPGSEVKMDGWDTWTTDKSIVAHWEHTILATPAGPEIATLRAEEGYAA